MRGLEILPTKGLNNGKKALLIEDGQSPRCLNVRFYQSSVKKRDGTVLYIADQAKDDEVTGIFQFKTDAQVISQIVCCGDEAYREGTAEWTSVKGSVTLTSNATYLFSAGVLNDLLVLTNGNDQILKWAGGTNNLAALGGSPPSKAGRLCVYKNFVILIDTTESSTRYPARVRWSGLNNPESWPAANYNPFVYAAGQTAKGFGFIGDQLYVFLDRSIHQMSYTGDSVTPFVFSVASQKTGAVSGGSIVSVDSACFFLGPRGPYFFDGTKPQYIGFEIEGTWRTANAARLQYAIGCHNPLYNEVWWSFSTGSGTTYDTTIVYNYVNQTWSIFQFGVVHTCFGEFQETLPTTPILGSSTGYVYKANYATRIDGAVLFNAYCDTKPLSLGNPTEVKRVREMQAVVDSETAVGSTLTVLTGYDLATPSYVNTIGIGTAGDVWGTGKWDEALWSSTGTLLAKFRPYGRGRYFQATIQNNNINQGFDVQSLIVYVDGEIQQ